MKNIDHDEDDDDKKEVSCCWGKKVIEKCNVKLPRLEDAELGKSKHEKREERRKQNRKHNM